MTENEMELTPEIEEDIRRVAALRSTGVESMRYYVQFGVLAPDWPEPSRRARRWLRQLDRL